jgi:DNA-binding response OmpR family regulator
VPDPVNPAVQRGRPQILVVDDDPQVVTMIATWLADVGDVHQATTSAQAYALATAIEPDLAIIDVILPRINGVNLLASLRRLPTLALMAVIMITGSDRPDILSAAAEAGAAAVFFKPLDESELRAAVSSLLRHRILRH